MAKRKFDPVHPGVVLAEDFLKGLEISQYRLAKGISVSARRINEIVQGKRSITADTARLPSSQGRARPVPTHNPAYFLVRRSLLRNL